MPTADQLRNFVFETGYCRTLQHLTRSEYALNLVHNVISVRSKLTSDTEKWDL